MTQIDSDIAVFSCEGPLTADLPLAATSNGACLQPQDVCTSWVFRMDWPSEQVYQAFLSSSTALCLPLRLTTLGYEFGTSMRNSTQDFRVVLSYLIVLVRRDWQVGAVISLARGDPEIVVGGEGHVYSDSGIAVAHDVLHACDAIDAYMNK